MRTAHIVLLVAVAALSVCVFWLNLKLHEQNNQFRKQLASAMELETAVNAPASGWAMPPLKSKRLDGTDGGIDLQHSGEKTTLLLFNPTNCPACEENWRFWEKLFADPDAKFGYFLITGANSISADYVQRHNLSGHTVRIAVDPSLLKQMRMQIAPQTIYLEHGTVKKVWFGLLSDNDVKEIDEDMQPDDQ